MKRAVGVAVLLCLAGAAIAVAMSMWCAPADGGPAAAGDGSGASAGRGAALAAGRSGPDEGASVPIRAALPAAGLPGTLLRVVHAGDGRALPGVEIVEVPYGASDGPRYRSDAAGCVRLPPATRHACLVGMLDGFAFTPLDRAPGSPEELVLALPPSRPLRGRVVNVPSGAEVKYELRVAWHPRHCDPQVREVLRRSPRAEVAVTGGAFAIDRAVESDATLWLRAADRRGGASFPWRTVSVPAAQDEVVFDLGGGPFEDPLADVTMRVAFRTAEPTGEFTVVLERLDAGSSGPPLHGSRTAGERLVVLRRDGVAKGRYEPVLTCDGGVHRGRSAEVAADTTLEMTVEQWTSLAVTLREAPDGLPPGSLALLVGEQRVATFAGGPPRAAARNLPPGRHAVAVSGPRLAAGPVEVEIAGRETHALELALHPVHRARVGVFHPGDAAGEVMFECDGQSVRKLRLGRGQRWLEEWLPPGRYLVTASFPGLYEQGRIDLFAGDAELRLGAQ